jgi:nitrogenase molybdenum-iron protein alpha/beta subunit
MQKQFDIPSVDDIIPIGFKNSSPWLAKIAHLRQLDVLTVIKIETTNAGEFVRSNINMVFPAAFEMSVALSLENN